MMAENHPTIGRYVIFAVVLQDGRSGPLVIEYEHFRRQPFAVKAITNRSCAHTRRFFHRTRVPLETSRIIETIDGPDFQQIRQRYAVEDPGEDWPKYLDLDRWIDINIRRIREIELDLSRPKRILDLGCGAGYFLHIAQLLGHKGLGLDLDYLPM